MLDLVVEVHTEQPQELTDRERTLANITHALIWVNLHKENEKDQK